MNDHVPARQAVALCFEGKDVEGNHEAIGVGEECWQQYKSQRAPGALHLLVIHFTRYVNLCPF